MHLDVWSFVQATKPNALWKCEEARHHEKCRLLVTGLPPDLQLVLASLRPHIPTPSLFGTEVCVGAFRTTKGCILHVPNPTLVRRLI
jgi:hypothetical protein